MARRKQSKVAEPRDFRIDYGPNLATNDLHLTVSGFKAIGSKTELRVAPLTVISGANSSGKSSFMQPFLLMKQTLESGFDPGALLLHGENAKFTAQSQVLSRGKAKTTQAKSFTVGMRSSTYQRELTFGAKPGGFDILRDLWTHEDVNVVMKENLTASDIAALTSHMTDYGRSFMNRVESGELKGLQGDGFELRIGRNRCFLEAGFGFKGAEGAGLVNFGADFFDTHTSRWSAILRGIIHVPGLRGNPEREYPRSAVGNTYSGTMETYVASVILDWATSDPGKVETLSGQLERLGLTWKVIAKRVNDAAVELLVGRMPHPQQGGALDMVSVADVGFGVSQTLPVLVALLAAQRGQIVYLEQPEIHLHPRAQLELAHCLVEAANRGVKVITETHSSLLIRAIQTEIATGLIASKDVSLNWFSRNATSGYAQLAVAELDEYGRFGDWPLDFDEIAEDADDRYLSALGSWLTE